MADCSFKNRNESSVDISSGHPTDPETSMDQSQQLELVMEQFTPWVFDEEPLAEEQTHKYDERANALNIHCEKMNVDLNAEKKIDNEENIDLQEAVEAKPKKVTELANDLRVSNEKVIKYEPDVSKPLEKISRKEDVIDGLMEEEKETDDDDKKNKEQIENKVEKQPVRAEWGYPTNLSTFNTSPCFPSNSFIMALINPVYKGNLPSDTVNLFPISSSRRETNDCLLYTSPSPRDS